MAAATKSWSTLSTAQVIIASTPTNSTSNVAIAGGFGIGVCGTVTNPASALSTGVTVSLQISGDGTNFYTIDAFAVRATLSTTFPFWFNRIPNDAGWIQLAYAGNTGSSVTITAIVAYSTGYS